MKALLSPFLSLMKEKEAKENQGLTEAEEVGGDNNASEKSTRQTSPPSAEGLSLMKEKEAKENQGIRDACQIVWVLRTRQKDACQVGRVLQTRQRGSCQVACIRSNFVGGRSRLDLLLPSFLLSREEKKGLFLRERRDLCQVAGDNHALEKSTRKTDPLSIGSFFLMREMEAPLSPFLSLMKEKETKENQGIRDACQVGRIP